MVRVSSSPLLAYLIRLFTGAHGPVPVAVGRDDPAIFFANHSSHLDFAVVWASLPPVVRDRTRPVAARDYWIRGPVRRFLADRVFRAVLIERQRVTVANNPLKPMLGVLDAGGCLIVFPEGTRATDGRIGEFKAGLYHLARARPGTLLVPVFLDNLNRILPRGEFLPVPLLGGVYFGEPIRLADGEPRDAFLERARLAVRQLQRDPQPAR